MEPHQIELVRSTWTIVLSKKNEAGEIFYKRLFEKAPQLKQLFSTDINEQAGKLVSTITFVITKLDKLDDILGEVQQLAKRHIQYGTEPAHYVVVGETLYETLAELLGSRWTPKVKESWFVVYNELANAMINAAR